MAHSDADSCNDSIGYDPAIGQLADHHFTIIIARFDNLLATELPGAGHALDPSCLRIWQPSRYKALGKDCIYAGNIRQHIAQSRHTIPTGLTWVTLQGFPTQYQVIGELLQGEIGHSPHFLPLGTVGPCSAFK